MLNFWFGTGGPAANQADWAYRHRGDLPALLLGAAATFAAAPVIALLTRKAVRMWFVIALVGLAGAVFVVVAFVAASHSAERDVVTRVQQVVAVLGPPAPKSMTQAAPEVYEVPDGGAVESKIRAAFAHPDARGFSDVSRIGPVLKVSFGGRACDGSVEVELTYAPATSPTTVSINGHCED